MKGLLWKDYYMMIKYCRMFLLFAVVFLGAAIMEPDNLFLLAYPVILLGMIPVNLLAYDEREKWDLYSAVLPYTRKQIVTVKYLIGMLINLSMFVLVMVVLVIQGMVNQSFHMTESLELGALLLALGLLTPMVVLPFSFKWGTEKGRVVYIICMAVACGGIFVLTSEGLLNPNIFQMKVSLLVLTAIMLVLYVISWQISIRFYEKKEL